MSRLFVILGVFFTLNSFAQKLNRVEVTDFTKDGKELITYLEFTLNAIGDNELSPKEKEIIISESYLKMFRDAKVQIEDDLDASRETVTNKDVQAYLKDIDFFFRYAHFTFNVLSIDLQTDEDGNPFLLTNILRTLEAVDLKGDTIYNDQQRFIEIEVNSENRELKIASIYTTKLHENEENIRWWNLLPDDWKKVLGTRGVVSDSIPFSSIIVLNENYFVQKSPKAELDFANNNELSDFQLGQDSISYQATKNYDTIWLNDKINPGQKESVFNALRQILETKDLNISGNTNLLTLEPINRLNNLRMLNISNTEILDILPVRNLTKLHDFNCSHTAINSIDALNYSASLTVLDISNTNIYDLKPLRNLEKLQFLDISNTRIENIDPLLGMKLVDLKMRRTLITDLTPLASLASLKYLYIDDNVQLHSLNDLKHLYELRSLSCNNTRIFDLTPLTNLPNLETIACENTEITSLSGLEKIPTLVKVYCDNSPLGRQKAIDFMKDNPQILVVYESKQLQLWWNDLPQWWKNVFAEIVELDTYSPSKEQLHEITAIKNINIGERSLITSLIPLNKLKNLQKLNAANTSVSKLDGISESREMRNLDISYTQVQELTMLEGLNLMEELSLSHCPVNELSSLHEMVNLKNLNIDNTFIDNLSALEKLQNLRYLNADNSKVDQKQFEDFIEHHPDIQVIYQTEELKIWWAKLDNSWKTVFSRLMNWAQEPTTEDLHKLIQIKTLEIKENRSITNLEPLAKFKHLRILKVNDTKITDVSPLSNLTYLKEVDLSRNPITNLNPLKNLANLEVLYLNNTLIEDLEWLVGLPQINSLDISSTNIKNLKELYNVFHLQILFAYNTKINNIKPLEDLPDLVLLKIYNSKVSQRKVDSFKNSHPNCEVDFY